MRQPVVAGCDYHGQRLASQCLFMTLRRRRRFMAFFRQRPRYVTVRQADRGIAWCALSLCRPPPRRRQRRVDCTTAAISPNRHAQPPAYCRSLPLSPMRSQGVRCLRMPVHGAQASNSAQPPMRCRSCAQLPPQRAQARPPRRRCLVLAELMQRGELRTARRMP